MTEQDRIYNTNEQLNMLGVGGLPVTAKLVENLLKIEPTFFDLEKSISEENIASFCKGCDHFKGKGIPCSVVGSNDQARYAARKQCGWADVDGKRTVK